MAVAEEGVVVDTVGEDLAAAGGSLEEGVLVAAVGLEVGDLLCHQLYRHLALVEEGEDDFEQDQGQGPPGSGLGSRSSTDRTGHSGWKDIVEVGVAVEAEAAAVAAGVVFVAEVEGRHL